MCAMSTLFIYLLLTALFLLALWGFSCKYTYSWGPNANNNNKKKSPYRAHKNIRMASKQLIYLGKGIGFTDAKL